MSHTKVKLASYDLCTGCMACRCICPVDAIHPIKDEMGFYYPAIKESVCINCQACSQVCPELHPVSRGQDTPQCYAAQAQDKIRLDSSSGGVFTLLALQVLSQGGVIFGAAMDKQFKVQHICIESAKDLPSLRGSKYVQSDVGLTYCQVEQYLKQNRTVLYVGCPCQIAGLRNILQDKYCTHLITVDLLCSGVPSQQFFLEWLSNNYALDDITHLQFRDKKHGQGWRCDSIFLQTQDGGEHILSMQSSSFLQAYQNKLLLRESCYHCSYNTKDRVGDISLGDFWGIEQFDPALNDNQGISLVLLNTKKGLQLFQSIEAQLSISKEVSSDYSPHNTIHGKKRSKPLDQKRFLNLLSRYSYQKALEYASYKRYDIGIVGCWSVENHGSNLSYYALYQFLRDSGFEVLMIERPLSSLWKPNKAPIGFGQSPYQPWDLAPIFENLIDMRKLNNQCDTFVVGSDQLFYHELYNSFGQFIDLSYIDSNKKKIAYAASVGRNHFSGTSYDRAKISHFLQEFDAISVRESDAVPLFQEDFGVNAVEVLDPVFLCSIKHYLELAKRGNPSCDVPYIFAYILDPSQEKAKILHQLSQDLQKPLKILGDVAKDRIPDGWDLPIEFSVNNETWIRAISDADFIVTDSFHGTCFSILFQKQFLSLINPFRGKSRFISLLSKLGLQSRMISTLSDYTDLEKSPIDYSSISSLVEHELQFSKNWLLSAIQNKKNAPLSTYDLLDCRLGETEANLSRVEVKTYNSESWLSNTHQRVNNLEKHIENDALRVSFLQHALEQQQELGDHFSSLLQQLQQTIECVEANGSKEHASFQSQLLETHQIIEQFQLNYAKQIVAYDTSLRELQEAVKLLKVESESKLSYMEHSIAHLTTDMDNFKKTIWYRIYKKFSGGTH